MTDILKFIKHLAKAIEQYVIKERHKDAYDTLNALEEISVDPDPIGAVKGYIKAWKEYLAQLKKELQGKDKE